MAACRRRSAGRLRFAAATLAAAMLPFCARAEPFFGADLRFAHDDNLTLASASADRLGDGFLTTGAYAGALAIVGDADSVSAQAGAHASGYARYTLLDAVSLEVAANWRRKLGVGLTAPAISLAITASHDDFRDDIRDSDRVDIMLVASTRLSERFDVSGGIAHDRRFAAHASPVVPGLSGAIYDTAGDSVFARAGYAVTPQVLLDAALRARRGDVVATTPEGFAIFLASSAIAPDPAFGPDRYGYRVRGTTKSASVAMSYAVDDRSAVNVEYTFAWTSAPAGLDYRSNLVSASWVWRY
jgi:hypothetical protein